MPLEPRRFGPYRRILTACIAATFLSMPANYAGSADTAHPHAFVQLWRDTAQGSLQHHRQGHPAPVVPATTGKPDGNAQDAPSLVEQGSPYADGFPLIGTDGAWFDALPTADGGFPRPDPSVGFTAPPDPPPPRFRRT